MSLRLSEGLLEETFAQLLECGSGERECVCYWSGGIDTPGAVDALLHPKHVGRWGFYEVDGAWINDTWLELARANRTIRAQIHTHAGEAFHSQLDDDFPIAQVPGFLSLVIPRFARGPVSLDGAFLARLTTDGRWEQLDAAVELELSR